jgi:hypothetical protein
MIRERLLGSRAPVLAAIKLGDDLGPLKMSQSLSCNSFWATKSDSAIFPKNDEQPAGPTQVCVYSISHIPSYQLCAMQILDYVYLGSQRDALDSTTLEVFGIFLLLIKSVILEVWNYESDQFERNLSKTP